MSVLDNFEQWKSFLANRVQAAEGQGMAERAVNEMAYRIGDYLAEEVEPRNNEERLLKELWQVGTEEEQQALANMMVKFVQNEGTNAQ